MTLMSAIMYGTKKDYGQVHVWAETAPPELAPPSRRQPTLLKKTRKFNAKNGKLSRDILDVNIRFAIKTS